MPISSTQKTMVVWFSLAAVAVALIIDVHGRVEQKLLMFAAMFFFFPPLMFLRNLDDTLEKLAVKFFGNLVVLYGAVAAAYSAHYLTTEGYLVGDAVHTWLEMTRAAAALYFFPIFFTFVRPHPDGENEAARGEVEEGEIVEPSRFTILLPGGIAVGIAFLPGSLIDTVFGMKECRAAVMAYCSYIALVCCTVGAAAAAVWFDLLDAKIPLAFLYGSSSLCLLNCLPRLIFPDIFPRGFNWRLFLPLAIVLPSFATTPLLMAYDPELKHADDAAWLIRMITWMVVMTYSSL